MSAYFLDSSAAAKLYVIERGSSWIADLADPSQRHELFVARVTAVEIAAALFRRVRAGSLSTRDAVDAVTTLRHDLQRTFRVVELNLVLTDLAMELAERHGLRGYDCVQLASALAVHRVRVREGLGPLGFVSADLELNAAGRAEGLDIDDPNNHP